MYGASREGQFRQDLYHRLAIMAVFIPRLRGHSLDILPLVDLFVTLYSRQFKRAIRSISPEPRRLLLAHSWPGNVRDLKNSIERAMSLEDEPILRPVYLPFAVGEAASSGLTTFEHGAALAPTAVANNCSAAGSCTGSTSLAKEPPWKRLRAR